MTQLYHRRRTSFGRIVGIVLGVLAAGVIGLILLCAGAGILVLWSAERALANLQEGIATAQREAALESAQATATTFLEDLRLGNVERAYGRTSQFFQQRLSLEQWQTLLRKHPELGTLQITDWSVISPGGDEPQTYRAILVAADGAQVAAVLDVIQEKECWVVARLTVH